MDSHVHSLLPLDFIAMALPLWSLIGCVPVSTQGTQWPKHETQELVSEITGSRYPEISDNDLVFELLSRGWSVGCDAELLPPRYWYEGNA